MSGGPATFHGRQNTRKEEEATRTNATTSVSKRAEGPPGMLDGLRDFCHLLSAEGQILYVSPATTMVTGHEPNKLVGRHIDDFIHADDKAVFKSEFYESIIHNKTTRFIYRFLRPNDSWTILESIFYPSTPVVSPQAALSQRSATGSQLLIVARPYASKNNALLDSFLEHKIEYERLLCQLQSLKSEEKGAELEDELETTPAQLQGAERPTTEAHESIETNDILKKAIRRSREQKQPATKVRSSLSTVGDLGIPVSESRDFAVPLKRKNTKRAKKEPHICMFCGTVNSPEWRKGPSGPKTLCNACGLRWAKSSTKMAQVSTSESDEDTMKQEE